MREYVQAEVAALVKRCDGLQRELLATRTRLTWVELQLEQQSQAR